MKISYEKAIFGILMPMLMAIGILQNDKVIASSRSDTPDDALQALLIGNSEFAQTTFVSENLSQLSIGQHPFAIVLSCFDSRVSDEIIMNQEVGKICTIRNAGNVVDDVVIASIEYALENFGSVLIFVLGHESCGAVTATVNALNMPSTPQPGHIKDVTGRIKPALDRLHINSSTVVTPDLIERAVKANVKYVVHQLQYSKPIIREAVNSGKVSVVGGYYSLDDGIIQVLN